MEETIGQGLARYVANALDHDFPARARAMAVDAITDCTACILAGSREPLAHKLLRVLPGSGERLLLGTGLKAAPADAALFNGAAAHALDYDDTNHPSYTHTTACMLPAMLAVAGEADASGADLVTGYILGFEMVGKLGRAMNMAHYNRGWHCTATFGTLAATVAAARVLRLTSQQIVMALGIAASAAGGLRANFGTMVKPLHAGYAARNAVLAVLLAREDFTACETALEHHDGYCSVMNGGQYDIQPLREWGRPLEILTEYGLALKPYPACGGTHTAIEAALKLHGDIRGEPIRSVRAGVSELAFQPLIQGMPASGLQGKFSLHYCVAAALIDGVVNLATFSDAGVARPEIRELVGKIRMEVDEALRDGTEFPAVLTVETESGARYEHAVPLAAGKPERWFSREQLYTKFTDCGVALLPPAALQEVFAGLQGMDNGDSADTVFAGLGGAGHPPAA